MKTSPSSGNFFEFFFEEKNRKFFFFLVVCCPTTSDIKPKIENPVSNVNRFNPINMIMNDYQGKQDLLRLRKAIQDEEDRILEEKILQTKKENVKKCLIRRPHSIPIVDLCRYLESIVKHVKIQCPYYKHFEDEPTDLKRIPHNKVVFIKYILHNLDYTMHSAIYPHRANKFDKIKLSDGYLLPNVNYCKKEIFIQHFCQMVENAMKHYERVEIVRWAQGMVREVTRVLEVCYELMILPVFLFLFHFSQTVSVIS